MKNVTATMSLAALLLAGTTQARDITINGWKSGDPLLSSFSPKLASDGQFNVVTIAETGTGLSALETELGAYRDLPARVSWTGTADLLYGPTQQIGLAPSIALAYDDTDNYDVAIEVHQGGQDSESSLWFQLGSNAPPSFSAINWGPATRLGPGHRSVAGCLYPCPVPPFDNGYNPTVAADLSGPPSLTSATVVEVHQADTGESALYYHVGVLALGPSPSISWGPSLPIGGTTPGFAPVVSIANNVAILVAQGSGGTLWYSIGVVDIATSTIAWTAPSSYGNGYNPTVSVYGDGTDLWIPGRVLVEAHQVDSGTGSLVYSVGVLDGSSPTSITWSVSTSGILDTNIPYATGCSPSVALAFAGHTPKSQVSVSETHAAACGGPSMTESLFGHLVGK
jgi:hypothetical protein